MKKETFLYGSIILAVAGIITKVLGIFYRVPLVILLKDEGVGLVQYAYSLYLVLLAISTAGLPVAISKLVAERVATNRYEAAVRVFRISLGLLTVSGLVVGTALFLGARFVTSVFFPDSRVYLSLVATAPAIFLVAVMSAFRGYFQGWKRLIPTAVSEILEQSVRIATAVGLAYILLPKGLEWAAAGATFGAVTGAAAGLVYLTYLYFKTRGQLRREMLTSTLAPPEEPETGTFALIREIAILAIPISIGGLILPLMQSLDSVIVARRLLAIGYAQAQATALFGQLSAMAFGLVNVPAMITFALAAGLVPSISEAVALGKMHRARAVLSTGIRITMALILPAAVGFIMLAQPIMALIYTNENRGAAAPLAVLSPGLLFLGLQQTTSAALQGIGRTDLPVKHLLTGAVVKTILTWVLTANKAYGINGAAFATSVGFLVSAVLNVLSVRKHLGVGFSFKSFVTRPVAAAVVMGLFVALFFPWFAGALGVTEGAPQRVAEGVATLVTIGVAAVLYLVVLTLIGGLEAEDFRMIPRLGPRLAGWLERHGLLRG